MQKSLIPEHSVALISEPARETITASVLFWSFADFFKFPFTFCYLLKVSFFSIYYSHSHKITKEAFYEKPGSVYPLGPSCHYTQAIFQNDPLKIKYTNSSIVCAETWGGATTPLSCYPTYLNECMSHVVGVWTNREKFWRTDVREGRKSQVRGEGCCFPRAGNSVWRMRETLQEEAGSIWMKATGRLRSKLPLPPGWSDKVGHTDRRTSPPHTLHSQPLWRSVLSCRGELPSPVEPRWSDGRDQAGTGGPVVSKRGSQELIKANSTLCMPTAKGDLQISRFPLSFFITFMYLFWERERKR